MTDYSKLRREGKLNGTIKNAKALRKHRDELAKIPGPETRTTKQRRPTYTIPLCLSDKTTARDRATTDRPRIRNWLEAIPWKGKCGFVHSVDNGSYSRGCHYTHWTYHPMMQSEGICTKKRLVSFIDGKTYKILAYKGYEFGSDNLGIYAVKSTHSHREEYRYHFQSDEAKNRTELFREVKNHHANQKEVAKSKKIRSKYRGLAIKFGVVTEKDSYAAGNCKAGTETFRRQNKLGKFVPIRVLASLKTANKYQVNRAIEKAIERNCRAFSQGYSRLVLDN